MKAAVITAFDRPPRYQDAPEPAPPGAGEMLVEVQAAGLHHLTRMRAAGAHYSGRGVLPLIPGVDGVGRGTDGTLRYFVLDHAQTGSMAERTVIDIDRSIVLPPTCDPVIMAAAMNPAMGPWLALRRRIAFSPQQKVLILGATGNSGRMAVQIAHHLGAGQVIAVGRDQQRLATLPALGATDIMTLGDPQLGALARDVDVVLDFIWGEPTAQAMELLITERADRNRPLIWIEIGSMAGATAPIPSAALRSSRLQIVGSGIGSVPSREILEELPHMADAIARGTLQMEAQAVPLADVERTWAATPDTSDRIVFIL